MDDFLYNIGDLKVFKTLDAHFGYRKIPMVSKYQDKASFTAQMVRYGYKKLHFGGKVQYQRKAPVLQSLVEETTTSRGYSAGELFYYTRKTSPIAQSIEYLFSCLYF